MKKSETTPAAQGAARERAVELTGLVDYGLPREVYTSVEVLYALSFERSEFAPVALAFPLVERLYAGSFPGYRACNTEYHDYCHSLEVFTSCGRLLDGAALAKAPISSADAADVLVAALVHDAGYIQEADDIAGTGAKYTRSHVTRSAAFIRRHAAEFGLSEERAERVARLVLGTDLARAWEELSFADEAERLAAAILAQADILGQMADRAYLEKLLFLYYEFREAGIDGYATAFDILKKTAGFYGSTKKRLDGPLGPAAGFAKIHFVTRLGVDRDLYREAIARQMEYLEGILADDKHNFRNKLKRMDIEAIERRRPA